MQGGQHGIGIPVLYECPVRAVFWILCSGAHVLAYLLEIKGAEVQFHCTLGSGSPVSLGTGTNNPETLATSGTSNSTTCAPESLGNSS